MKACTRILLVLLSLGTTTYAQDASRLERQFSPITPERAFVKWARTNAILLKTTEPGSGFTDMTGLGEIVGRSRIVALGEATHGTHEFFQLKHRIIEYLTTQKGFTVFSIEANMPEAYRLNNYVLRGEGDPKKLIKGMYFWTWDTKEVLDLILWMREINASGRGHNEFTGFDMQNPTVAIEIVNRFLERQEPSYADSVAKIYRDVAARRGDIAPKCAEIIKHLEDHRAIYEEHPHTDDIDWVIQMARLVHQSVQMNTGEKSRDESMAENVKWIANHSPQAKLVLWAHNGHITYDGDSYVPMGSYLKNIFGSEIVNFGFKFNEGSFRAYGEDKKLHEFTIGPAPESSLDQALASMGEALFALDIRKLPSSGPARTWASAPHLSRSIGAVFGGPEAPSSLVEVPVSKMFDAIIFINTTSAAKPN